MQLESPEKEDTGVKQVDPVDIQNQDVQFGNLVTQPFKKCQSIIEVGCLSFTQMLQEYLRAYPPPSHANA